MFLSPHYKSLFERKFTLESCLSILMCFRALFLQLLFYYFPIITDFELNYSLHSHVIKKTFP